MQKLDLNKGDEVVLLAERQTEVAEGPVSINLWVVRTTMGWRALLRAIHGLKAIGEECVFMDGDLARVYLWLQEPELPLAMCYGLRVSSRNSGRIGLYLVSELGELVKAKAGELGMRPGIAPGMPVAPESTPDIRLGKGHTRPVPPMVHRVEGKAVHMP